MLVLPPTPEIGLLQIPLPNLSAATPESPVWRCSRAAREAEAGEGDLLSTIRAALLARDLGRIEESMRHCNDAFLRAFQEGSATEAAHALSILATSHSLVGDFRSAKTLLRQVRSLADEDPSGGLLAYHDESAATLHLRTAIQDWYAGARELFERTLTHYEAAGNRLGQARLCASMASCVCGYGEYILA